MHQYALVIKILPHTLTSLSCGKMSEAITGVLKLAFGFISNKLRTNAAEKLQDGGLTDQKFRGWIVRELHDIKSKLDAMSRKDLCASISFLEKGIKRLDMSVGEFSESGDRDESPSTSELPGAVKNSRGTKPAPQSVTVENAVALADAITKLKIEPNECFDLAKKSFQDASKQATLAFHNAALSTDERILASKVRFASGILEHLENPEMAASDCLQYLKELHDMAAIKEIFSVYIQGGVKSVFKRDSRKEMVETVTMINLILADFISKFTRQRMTAFDWPTIVCGKRVVHPIHFKSERLPNLSEMKISPPWDIVELERELNLYRRIRPTTALLTLTKKEDLICFTTEKHGPQKLVKTTHELQPYCHPESRHDVRGVAVDEDDTVYVVTYQGDRPSLSVYSADGKNKSTLQQFVDVVDIVGIAITDNKNIVIANNFSWQNVYVYNRNGGLERSFNPNEGSAPNYYGVHSVSVSSNNEIALVTYNGNEVLKEFYRLSIYTQDGKFQRTVKFRTSSDWSDRYKEIFYNHVTNTIIGYGGNWNDGKSFIEFMSGETGELQCSYLLYFTSFPEEMSNFCLVCHINGTMALVGKRHVIYLQNSSPST